MRRTEGVTLSGVLFGRGLQSDGTLEKPIELGAEGASALRINLSGKRTKYDVQSHAL